MASDLLSIWCNLPLPEPALARLVVGVAAHELIRAKEFPVYNQPLGRADAFLPRADIAFGQPEADQCVASARLRWVQVASAGYTSFAAADVRAALVARGVAVTNSSSVYDEPCAQHALAFLLSEARQLPRSLREQVLDRGWSTVPTRAASFLLSGQTVLLVGYGAIARRLAELLSPFRMNLVGFRRQPRGDEAIAVQSIDQIDAWLPRADGVIDILPAAADTQTFFDRTRFARMKPGSIFINIGRGTTVDQDALLAALSGHLRAAYLDVTTPEPLPPEHPLWLAPNCFITPHVAVGHGEEYQRLVELFLANLERFQRGEPLLCRVY